MRQSSRRSHLLPARQLGALALLVGWSAPVVAQTTYRVTQAENFRRDPSTDAPVLATVEPGSQLGGGGTTDGWTDVSLEGWIWARSVEPTTGGEHDLRVTARQGENLRSGPNRPVIARVSFGTLLDRVERNGEWIRVRRRGWMWNESLAEVAESAPQTERAPPRATGGEQPGLTARDSAARLDRAVLERQAPLQEVPDGDTLGLLSSDAPVKILARSGDWVRVQLQGWIRDSELRPASPGVLVGVSGAEVRAMPEDYEGRVLQWSVQYIAVQEADELRQEMPLGQAYMLARGPLPEAGFVYVVLTSEQRARVERLPRLANLVIIGRVRIARTRYLGNTILDLIDLVERAP